MLQAEPSIGSPRLSVARARNVHQRIPHRAHGFTECGEVCESISDWEIPTPGVMRPDPMTLRQGILTMIHENCLVSCTIKTVGPRIPPNPNIET